VDQKNDVCFLMLLYFPFLYSFDVGWIKFVALGFLFREP
jgi:hypothetical protein